mmetsp:Transcript_44110/g.139184  ORF Transcript_44110/g.139184 Transcript_44110/m.139184 type:complete len:811 (-) Transcript_44110:902-3334(-)
MTKGRRPSFTGDDDGNQGGGLLSNVSAFEDKRAKRCFLFPKSWDIHWSDLYLLLTFRFRDFRHRKERRLFDAVDTHKTGYVTLDELIHFQEQAVQGSSLEDLDIPLLTFRPDISRSLVALYHFDVALEGHLSFDEFLLLQDYLRQVEYPDEEVVCGCIPHPKVWLKRLKKKKGRKSTNDGNNEDQIPLRSPKNRRTHTGERILARRINAHGELQELDCDQNSYSMPEPSPARSYTAFGVDDEVNSDSNDAVIDVENFLANDPSQSEDETQEMDEEDSEALAAEEKRQQDRRAMLVQALKSSKGRKRFIEWLYRLADTTESDDITMDELVVFLKAIRKDGINPEAFVDPSEDYDDAGKAKRKVSQPLPSRIDPNYLQVLAERIMLRYNDNRDGKLTKEEFMQLASMVEREYELFDNAYQGGDIIGPYRLLRTLGKGAEGVVKLANNVETGEKKAVKIIRRGNVASMSRVDREVEAMVMLNHPAVVSVNEVLETESSIFLVMEYCAGGHIEDYISPTRPMSEAAARFYFSQLLDGMLYCHQQCVCHRDLRIENLMLDNRGNLKITDFGHAGIFQQGWDVFQTMLVGSISHLAPEQVTGTVYSGEKIDMWSVGIILYIMVTGCAPFQGDSAEELLQNIKEASYVALPEGIVGQGCGEIIRSTLQVDHSARPSCAQLKEHEWMNGPMEKLVLAHCDFFLRQSYKGVKEFVDDIKLRLTECDSDVTDTGIESVEATVRTVSDDEEFRSNQMEGMRPVSMSVLHCVHKFHNMVFKVLITMMSNDAGVSKLYPLVEFDLQSGYVFLCYSPALLLASL